MKKSHSDQCLLFHPSPFLSPYELTFRLYMQARSHSTYLCTSGLLCLVQCLQVCPLSGSVRPWWGGGCLRISDYRCITMQRFSWDFFYQQNSMTIRVHSGLWTTSQSATVIILSLMAQTCLNRPSTARITRRGCLLLSLSCQYDSSLINHKRMLMCTKNVFAAKDRTSSRNSCDL